jgi:ketoreductase
MSVQGTIAVVTGGGAGIGAAICRRLAADGATVAALDVAAGAAQRTIDAIGSGLALAADVGDSASVDAAFARLERELGPVDILVNNAGRSGGGVTADLADELWDDVIDTNLNSVFRMTREALNTGGMRARDWGRVINIASTAGKQGVVLGAPYSASKHGVVGFTKALGNELAPTGITVNAVCPGYVETPMAQRVRQGYAAAYDSTEEQILAKFRAKIPLGRYSTPEEVAGMVGYLATDTAASVTAQAINVCGGLGNF